MQDFNAVAKDLFDKIRGRFPSVTIGDDAGKITNQPELARFFDFEYTEEGRKLGNVSVSINEDDGLTVIYSRNFIQNENDITKTNWYDFLKELRVFSKKRMMEFDVRDINKTNLTKRDYKFLSRRSEDDTMNESKLYGTSQISYQNIGEARLVIKHTESVNQELATGRTQKIGKIYIESADGERFMYPYKHLSGARAMARHVAEGGKPFDDFGKHIVGLSEEMGKLRKFKNYVGRSAVMAESLEGYMDIVKDRITTVKKTIESLQKPNYYAEAVAGFETPVFEEVPDDVRENWVDELTIKQFNEELQDVFPYIYNLVKEGTKARELTPEEMEKDLEESGLQYHIGKKKYGKEGMAKLAQAGREGASEEELGKIKDKFKKTREEIALEQGFEEMMGQFAEAQEINADELEHYLKAFTEVANDMNVYGDVKPETIMRHLEQGDVDSAIEEVMFNFSGPDGAEPGRGFSAILDDLEDDFRYLLDGPENDGQPDFDQEYSDDDPMDYTMDSIEEDKKDVLFQIEDEDGDKYEVVKYMGKVVAFDANPEELPGGGMGPYEYDPKTGTIETEHGPKKTRKVGDQTFDEADFDKNFQKRIAATAKGGKGAEYMKKKADQYKQQNKELDPGAAAKGLGIGVLDARKAYAKAKKKGAKFPSRGVTTSPNTRNPNRLPEANDSYYDKVDPHFAELGRRLQKVAKTMKDEERSNMVAVTGTELQNYEGDFDKLLNNLEKVGVSQKQLKVWLEKAEQLPPTSGADIPDPDPEMDTDEGNAYGDTITAARKAGKKPGDKIKGPDGEEITLSEFILSYFDRETGQFPKGETAVLTMIEKDFGEQFIEPAKQFMEMINNKMAEMYGYKDTDMQEDYKLNDADKAVMQKLTGMIKQKQKEMQDARKGGYDEDVRMIASQLEDFYAIAELIQGKRPMGLDTSVMDLVHDMYDEVGAKFDEGNEELDRIKGLAGL